LPGDHGQFGTFCAYCGRNHRFDGALSCRRSGFALELGMICAHGSWFAETACTTQQTSEHVPLPKIACAGVEA
jgi:hypothetical protein